MARGCAALTSAIGSYTQAPSTADDTEAASVDWSAAVTALDAGRLPCSGGEGRMLRLAASLAGGCPVDLRDSLTELDDRNTDLVSQAILHATGRRHQPTL